MVHRTKLLLIDWATRHFLAATIILAAGLRASAQDVQHLSITKPGGMPGSNVITGITLVSNGVQVTWDGPSGYYQLFESATTNPPIWRALGGRTNLVRTATVADRYSNSYFRVSGPLARYTGSQSCAECHEPILNTVKYTRHFAAFTNASFEADGGQTNKSCLACHTVGFGLPSGFVSHARTPHLAGVQCENCHGAAAHHAANPDDPSVRPRIEVAAQVCGGCHNDVESPTFGTFGEWTNSTHAQVTTNINLNATNQIDNCGRCHSGSSRVSLLTGMPLPTGDAEMGIVCVTCHDPHQTNENPEQLRSPITSTNDFFMPTNGAFASFYKPEIGICAQCHNHAGASWTNNESEPHHSAQYNIYLGTVGELESGAFSPLNPHAAVTNQCVGCHMQTTPFVSATKPGVTGHSFKVETNAVCINCHFTANTPLNQFLMTILVTTVTNEISDEIQALKFDLDYWAASTNAPPALSAKYGNLAWEYTTPGSLNLGRGPGPNAEEQLLIPENIRKARYNLYLVQNEGSLGIHNPTYIPTLLSAAEDWIAAELDP